MADKLITYAIPCYNSAGYMDTCIESILACGASDIEVVIVDDGSTKDNTYEKALAWQRDYPDIVKAVHQENGGHGAAVMTGLAHASGLYFKVVDSDDWVDEAAFQKALGRLRSLEAEGRGVDLLVTNYIYDKVELGRKREIHYKHAFRENEVLTWDEVRRFRPWENLLMHALIYRTEVLRKSGLDLPKHTFYVDNLYCSVPLASVESLYYMDLGLYHYFIGREGQSVQEETMIRRIDQQIRVNKLMMDQLDLEHVPNERQRETIFHYHDMITTVTSIMLILGGTPEHLAKKDELWEYIRTAHPWEYNKLRWSLFGITMNLPGRLGRRIAVLCYRIANRIFSFN